MRYEKARTALRSDFLYSVINQFRFHNFLRLCLASVHRPYPFRPVIGYPMLDNTVL